MTTQCNGLLIAEQPIERNFCIKVFQKITFINTKRLQPVLTPWLFFYLKTIMKLVYNNH